MPAYIPNSVTKRNLQMLGSGKQLMDDAAPSIEGCELTHQHAFLDGPQSAVAGFCSEARRI